MRSDLQQAMALSARQHSNDWFRQRQGRITGSQVGRLMHSGRAKDAIFSADAEKYLWHLLQERDVNSVVLCNDEYYDEYLKLTSISGKALAWGTEKESEARDRYEEVTGNKVTLCGALDMQDIEWFASSPDGLVIEGDGVVEIKCPLPDNYTIYKYSIHSAEDLKKINDTYYWQVFAHMLVTGAAWCDWVAYCPFDEEPIHIVRIERDEDVLRQMRERIAMGNDWIKAKRAAHKAKKLSV